MNLDVLLDIVQSVKGQPTAEEVAEAIWLFLRQPPLNQGGHDTASTSATSQDKNPKSGDAAKSGANPTTSTTPPQAGSSQPSSGTGTRRRRDSEPLFAPDDVRGRHAGPSGSVLNVPTPTPLPDGLNIGRALRPLRRHVNSRTRFVLDEQATARKSAEEDMLVPVLRPERARWLSVELVVDNSDSMVIWRTTALEFARLLSRVGAFRNVRLWSLDTRSTTSEPHLYAGMTIGTHRPTARRLNELADVSGQRLVLLVSDCVSPGWHGGAVARALHSISSTNPIAIVQVLPTRLWDRTALDREIGIEVRGLGPGTPNERLDVSLEDDWFDDGECLPQGIPMPVIALDARWIQPWTRLLRGSDAWVRGVLLTTYDRAVPAPSAQLPNSAATRVAAFYGSASVDAQKLAESLAVAPLTLPVVYTVQRAARLPPSQADVAEVLFGGLAYPKTRLNEVTRVDEILFEFHPGVRDELIERLKRSEAKRILEAVTTYLEDARRVYMMRAVVSNLGDASRNVSLIEDLPFARARAAFLRSLGYEDLADQLAQGADGSGEADNELEYVEEALTDSTTDRSYSPGDSDRGGGSDPARREQQETVPIDPSRLNRNFVVLSPDASIQEALSHLPTDRAERLHYYVLLPMGEDQYIVLRWDEIEERLRSVR